MLRKGDMSDESSSEDEEDDSQASILDKAKEIEHHKFRLGSGISNHIVQLRLSGHTISCLNFKKRMIIALDEQWVTFVLKGLCTLAEASTRCWLLKKKQH